MAARPGASGPGAPAPPAAAWGGGGPQAVRGGAGPQVAVPPGYEVGLEHVPAAAPTGRAAGAAVADPPQPLRGKQHVKTRICKHQLKGFCKYQDKCLFAHSREELKQYGSKLCATCLSPGCSKERCPGPRSFDELGGGAVAYCPLAAGDRPAAGSAAAAAPPPPGRSASSGPATEVMQTVQKAMYEAAQQAAQMVLREALPLLEQQTGQARGSLLVEQASEQALQDALRHGSLQPQAGAPPANPAAARAAAQPSHRLQQQQQRQQPQRQQQQQQLQQRQQQQQQQQQQPLRRQQQQQQRQMPAPQPPPAGAMELAEPATTQGSDAAVPRPLAAGQMRRLLAERTPQLSKGGAGPPEVGERALLCSALCEIVQLLQEEEEVSESSGGYLARAGRAEASAGGGAPAPGQAAAAPPAGSGPGQHSGLQSDPRCPGASMRRIRLYARGDDELPVPALPGGGLPRAAGPAAEGPLTSHMLAELSRLVCSGSY